MRIAFAVAVACSLLVAPGAARAQCPASQVSFFPAPGTPLSANGRIVVEGRGSQGVKAVEELPARKVKLVADKEEISTIVVATYKGHLNAAQLVLEPSKPLKPGVTYTMKYDKPPSDAARELPPASWAVIGATATAVPRWDLPPKLASFDQTGKGDAVKKHARIAVAFARPCNWVLAELEGGDAGEQRFLVRPSGSELELGGNSCSMDFGFIPGRTYKAKLTAMGENGLEAPAPAVVSIPVPKK